MNIRNNIKKHQHSKMRSAYYLGCIIAFAVITLSMCSCGPYTEAAGSSGTETDAAATASSSISSETTDMTSSSAVSESESVSESETEQTFTFIDRVVCIADDYVNIRYKANIHASIIGTIPSGGIADVIEYKGDWTYIYYKDKPGYVSSEYITGWSMPDAAVPEGDWAAILVNPSNHLPEDIEVSVADFEGGQVDERILEICEEMFSDAKEDGVSLILVDAYRTYDRQNELFQEKTESYVAKGYSRKDAEDMAATITARPGTSEHQTGLALDIVTESYMIRDRGFEDTRAFRWLSANAQNYGFVLRYMQDKESFTKIIYEPWHWRFVGTEAAAAMKESGWCLEEHLGITD
jgi:LAS superfamily LD-carboxypeptidase LdcB